MKRPPDVAIIGLGLIGGSLARALTRAGHAVSGVDWPAVVRCAQAAGAIRIAATRAEEVAGASVIVLAAPPRTNLSLLRRLARRVAPETVITDLGSVKSPICSLARDLRLSSFVGGHPMTGSERSGFAASHPDLFADRPWIVTTDGSTRRAVGVVRAMARDVGARVHTMRAQEHDRTVAFLSHVPQIVAWALAGAARGDGVARRHLDLAGPGFRDMTRLSRSPRPLWREILAQNEVEVSRALKALSLVLKRRV